MPPRYPERAGAGHVDANLWSILERVDFLDARAAGTPLDPASTCARGPAVRCSGTP